MRYDRLYTPVRDALAEAGEDPAHSLSMRDVPALAGKVVDTLGPAVSRLAGAEPWYASRVAWGAIISAVAPLLGLGAEWLDPDIGATLLASAGALLGAAVTLYGRWRTQRGPGASR